ncbi:MAG TPA: DUF4350 domain-containing protein, partial [Candidatus Angelobacter sp.]|nr:DUF4350 domain-containing protein [Candidatus Angelobacter sp.]
ASSYSTASSGAKAAYLLLQEQGYHVERWKHDRIEVESPRNTVLVIADPAQIAHSAEKAAIEQFISEGGRVITNGIAGASFLPQDASEVNMPATPWAQYPALMPSAITRAAPKITMTPVASWGRGSGIPLYGEDKDTVVVRIPHGQGDAIWLGAATPFTNAGITQPGSLEFVLAVIGDKQHTRVLFDEYVHGYGADETIEKRHPLMIALVLQSVVLALAGLFTFSRRSGPLRPMPAESRLAPLEFVETLGSLYQQAHAASVAVDVSYRRFQFWVTRRLGLASTTSPEDIARAVRERWRINDDSFLETLRAAASARYQPDLPEKEALKIVESLYSYSVRLKLFSFPKKLPKEKN